jgi:hypothetical protein
MAFQVRAASSKPKFPAPEKIFEVKQSAVARFLLYNRFNV